MFCPKCGQQLEDGSAFCVYCGTKMQAENEPYREQSETEPYAEQSEVYGEVPEESYDEDPVIERKSGISVFTHIAVICACILIFVLLVAGTFILTIRQSTTEEAIGDIVKDIDIADIRIDNIIDDTDDDMTLVEYIHDYCINEDLVKKYNLSESNIEELLQDNDIQKFVSDKLDEYFEYIYSGGSEPKVTSKEVVKLLEKNEKTVYKITGYQMTDKDYEEIKEAMSEGQLDALDLSNISAEYSGVFTALRVGLSYGCLIGLGVLTLLLCILIFALYRYRVASAFLSIGVTALIAGIGEFMFSIFSGTLITTLCDSLSLPRQVIRPIVEQVFAYLTQIAAIITGVGVALIVIHIVIKICIKNLRKSEEE